MSYFSRLSALFRVGPRSRGAFGSGDTSRTRCLRLEELEDRRLLSLSPSAAAAADIDVFSLHSLENCQYVLYLDFDGHTTNCVQWNYSNMVTPSFSLDADEENFSTAERAAIYEIWQRVAEDFLPFNVDVTTEAPTGDDCSAAGVQRVCIGGSYADWYKSAVAGISKMGLFDNVGDVPNFVFSENLNTAKSIAEAVSHELGHTFGLNHDGYPYSDDPTTYDSNRYDDDYYQGANGWGPIMGAPYIQNLTQWSCGDYTQATNSENDLTIIAGQLINANSADGFRADDCGDNWEQATAISIAADRSGYASGIIERNTDVDFYSFRSTGSALSFWVGGLEGITNLDVKVTLFSFSNLVWTEIQTCDPLDTLFAEFSFTGSVGTTYYLSVEGVGKTVDGSVYYTDYGSLGAYEILIGQPVILTVTTTLDNVEKDGELSLREAILIASSRTQIVFSEALRTDSQPVVIELTGCEMTILRSIDIDASALEMIDETTDESSLGLVIDAQEQSRIFNLSLQTDLTVLLTGLKLVNGLVSSETGNAFGGAIYNASDLTLVNCEISDCAVSRSATNEYYNGGGAIYSLGKLTVNDSLFSNNIATDGYGGGVFCSEMELTLNGAKFIENSASIGAGIYAECCTMDSQGALFDSNTASREGAGLYLYAGEATLIDSTIQNNTASNAGGGLFGYMANISVSDSVLSGNSAGSYGGALYNAGTATLVNVTVVGNYAATYGGGLYVAAAGNISIYNSVLSGNSAGSRGGALYNAGTATLVNVTVAGNYAATYGGGVFTSGTLTANNSIFAENRRSDRSDDLFHNTNTAANVVLNNSLTVQLRGGAVTASDCLTADPCFVKFAEYSTWTAELWKDWDLHLTSASPALDAGSNEWAKDAAGNSLTSDLDGRARTLQATETEPARVDLGAYEYPFFVTGTTLVAQVGCCAFLSGDWAGKTLAFDLDGDGLYDDCIATGVISVGRLAQTSDSGTVCAKLFENGAHSDRTYVFEYELIPVATVYTVRFNREAGGQIVRLSMEAVVASGRAITNWTLQWGDGESTAVESLGNHLVISHLYTQSGDFSIWLSTTEYGQTASDPVLLATHEVELETAATLPNAPSETLSVLPLTAAVTEEQADSAATLVPVELARTTALPMANRKSVSSAEPEEIETVPTDAVMAESNVATELASELFFYRYGTESDQSDELSRWNWSSNYRRTKKK